MADNEVTKEKARLRREWVHTTHDGSRKYSLRLPTVFEMSMIYADLNDGGASQKVKRRAAIAWIPAERAILCGRESIDLQPGVIGWEGIRVGDLSGDEGDTEPQPWSSDMVPTVLDCFPLDAEELGNAVFSRLLERRERLDKLKKN